MTYLPDLPEFKKKRRKTGGRQKGSQNKITKEVKELISAFIHGNFNILVDTINAIENPKDRADIFIKLLPYVTPKEQKIELDGDVQVSAVNVQFKSTGISPTHNEDDYIDD